DYYCIIWNSNVWVF
nr:immunoglobulin light chain junction region [Macaca mulatta]